jgi:hypothetical protein
MLTEAQDESLNNLKGEIKTVYKTFVQNGKYYEQTIKLHEQDYENEVAKLEYLTFKSL